MIYFVFLLFVGTTCWSRVRGSTWWERYSGHSSCAWVSLGSSASCVSSEASSPWERSQFQHPSFLMFCNLLDRMLSCLGSHLHDSLLLLDPLRSSRARSDSSRCHDRNQVLPLPRLHKTHKPAGQLTFTCIAFNSSIFSLFQLHTCHLTVRSLLWRHGSIF